MKKTAKKKISPSFENADVAVVFRRWLALRIRGEQAPSESKDSPVPSDSPPEVPSPLATEAWAIYSWLAEQGAEKLAYELGRVIGILFHDLNELGISLPPLVRLYGRPATAPAFLEGLDAALAESIIQISMLAEYRAVESCNAELVTEEAYVQAGDPARAEFLMQRYFELVPEEEARHVREGGLISRLIQTACNAAEVLERLEEKYPEAVEWEARFRDRWPVLRRRNDKALHLSPAQGSLGKEYPLDPEAIVHDARKGSLRSYLAPLVVWLSHNRSFRAEGNEERLEEAKSFLQRRGNPWYMPCGPTLPLAAEVLAGAAGQPPLRKDTAVLWADKLVVPFIMATDAADLKSLKEPALKAIWKQTRVKSVKTFRSRLLDAVRKELPRMARK